MGAQNAQRLNLYIDRFESCLESNDHSKELYNELMEDPEQTDKANEVLESIVPPYYYGSHYSTPLGCVLYYLLREEPYTSLNVRLQDGHFDVPDRLFHSVFVTGRSCYENLPEVKELTPEWFFSIDFLVNRNHHHFGALQGGAEVDDVALPATLLGPATPQAFLSRHMQAFEGPVVSTLLSQWIDLIFGFKQQGQQAVNSYNLFYYLTYPDQVDLSSAPDLETRNRLITQAAHFGQCPALAFTATHPQRQLRLRAARDLRSVLLETNRMSIYLKHSMEGIGDRCRICRVSDVDPGALSILPSSVQRILGTAECADNADRFFDASSPDCARSVEGAGSLPLILCPEPCLTWPADCHYPWIVEIDCNEFCVVTSFKVVLADRYDGAPPSAACYGVEFLAEDGRWTAVSKRISAFSRGLIASRGGVAARGGRDRDHGGVSAHHGAVLPPLHLRRALLPVPAARPRRRAARLHLRPRGAGRALHSARAAHSAARAPHHPHRRLRHAALPPRAPLPRGTRHRRRARPRAPRLVRFGGSGHVQGRLGRGSGQRGGAEAFHGTPHLRQNRGTAARRPARRPRPDRFLRFLRFLRFPGTGDAPLGRDPRGSAL